MSVIVCSDAGHGGIDPGTSGKGLTEKVLTLEASQYVSKRLNQLGVKTTQTRTSDVSLKSGSANTPRTNAVKNSRAKICLSHHFNAGGGNGGETIHSIHSDGKLARMILEEWKAIGHPVRSAYTRKHGNGDYYYMHRQTGNVATIIVEYDFLDNPSSNKVKDKNYREKLYEAVVKAVCRHLGVAYKTSGASKPNNSTGTTGETYYRVVTGSFKSRKNADQRVSELKKKGYDSFIEVFKK